MIKRGFFQFSRIFANENPQIFFGLYEVNENNQSEGSIGEMCMEWELINYQLTPQLKCFNDGWNALSTFSDLLAELAKYDNQDISEEKFIEILLSCGFIELSNN